jgi:hypothetical protein
VPSGQSTDMMDRQLTQENSESLLQLTTDTETERERLSGSLLIWQRSRKQLILMKMSSKNLALKTSIFLATVVLRGN